jgi:CubicO group peptidase (beta-lactamase class C family)
MRRQVFEPVGMSGTAPDSAAEPPADRATLYWPRTSEDPRYGHDVASDADYSCFSGAGAFLSTPSDLVRFGMALGSGKLLKPETVKMLQTPQRLSSGEESEYGLGWGLKTVPLAGEQTRVAGHGRPLLPEATLMGGSTSLITFPERGITVSVTSNISSAETSNIAIRIAEVFVERAKTPARD